MLTYKLKSPRKILLDTNEAFLQLQVNGANEKNLTGFTLTYQRYGNVTSQIVTAVLICWIILGEVLTTTPTSGTTEIDWPTPAHDDKIYYTAYIGGHSYTDYSKPEIIQHLKNAIKSMAAEYCETQEISLSRPIT